MIKPLTSLLTRREALQQLFTTTAARTNFAPELIEKDFYLTIILEALAQTNSPLIFKGGTCLNKCYQGYYRLSEDLDFIHVDSGKGNRAKRKSDFGKIVTLVKTLTGTMEKLKVSEPQKFDEHHQLRIDITYPSLYNPEASIKFEVTHRNPSLKSPVMQSIKHMFHHPVTGLPYAVQGTLPCIDLEEAVAEKVRACLTRKNPAIRDFFDLWYIHDQKPA